MSTISASWPESSEGHRELLEYALLPDGHDINFQHVFFGTSVPLTVGIDTPLAMFRIEVTVKIYSPGMVHSEYFPAFRVLPSILRSLWTRRL